MVSFLVLGTFLRLFHSGVEISHPVFGILFQESVGLTVLSGVSLLNDFLPYGYYSYGKIHLTVAIIGAVLHQSSWMVVTILR